MSDENTLEYYRRREQQANAFAELAKSLEIKAIHKELAQRYAELAAGKQPCHLQLLNGGIRQP